MSEVSVVFQGTVLERKTLPQRGEMRGRGRYAITFRVNEYWKGSPGRSVIVYGVDAGTDCRGDGGYAVGMNYLVYADEVEARGRYFGQRVLLVWLDRRAPEGDEDVGANNRVYARRRNSCRSKRTPA